MQDHQVKELLRGTLLDGQLDRTERDSLRAWLAEAAPEGARRAVYQSMAFDLAREALEHGRVPSHQALNWLERVVKLLTPLDPSGHAPAAGTLPGTHPGAAGEAEAWFSPEQDCAGRIVTLLGRARTSVDVCVFTITDDRITSTLAAAHRRGVAVRVITDDEKQFDPGSDIGVLEQAGVPVRFDRTAFHMHHKFALFDGALLLTGSYNWTRSAALHNEENFILTPDPRLLDAFARLFKRLWDEFAPRTR